MLVAGSTQKPCLKSASQMLPHMQEAGGQACAAHWSCLPAAQVGAPACYVDHAGRVRKRGLTVPAQPLLWGGGVVCVCMWSFEHV